MRQAGSCEKTVNRYQNGKLTELWLLTLRNSDNAGERTISESIQHDFKQVGIKLDIRGEEKQAFLDRQKNRKGSSI